MKLLSVRNFFVPIKCPVCHEPLALGSEDNGVLCEVCRPEWELEKQKPCPECGLEAIDCTCMPNDLRAAGAECLLKLCYYEAGSGSSADRFVLYMKDYNDRQAFRFAAKELCKPLEKYFASHMMNPKESVFTYAPRSRRAIEKKGFDQSRIISELCAKEFGAVSGSTVRRLYIGKQQKGLVSEKRKENADRSFVPERNIDLTGYTVVLFDDIVTTGASLSACTRIIKNAGAERVICLAIAKTENKRQQK